MRAPDAAGAHYAGAAIEQSMLGAGARVADPLTAQFEITHGIAMWLMLAYVVHWNAEASARSTPICFDGPGPARIRSPANTPRRRARAGCGDIQLATHAAQRQGHGGAPLPGLHKAASVRSLDPGLGPASR